MALHFEMLGCMYVCVRESVFVCSSVHGCVCMCVCMLMYLFFIYRIVLMLRLHISNPAFEHTVNSRMKTLLHFAPTQRLLYS